MKLDTLCANTVLPLPSAICLLTFAVDVAESLSHDAIAIDFLHLLALAAQLHSHPYGKARPHNVALPTS